MPQAPFCMVAGGVRSRCSCFVVCALPCRRLERKTAKNNERGATTKTKKMIIVVVAFA